MKALLIQPATQTIEEIDISGHEDIAARIGFDSVISDAIGPADDRLFFDEDCFLRGTEGRFQIGSVIPVSGAAVIVGSPDDGKTLTPVTSDIAGIEARIKYL